MIRRCGIAVIDSEPSIRDLLDEYLRNLGYRVYPVNDVTEAVPIISSQTIPIALVDLGFCPVDQGIIATLRRAKPDLRIILMTGRPTLDGTLDAFRGGIFDLVIKPFHLDDLKDIISRAVTQVRKEQHVLMLQRRIKALERALQRAGLELPPDETPRATIMDNRR